MGLFASLFTFVERECKVSRKVQKLSFRLLKHHEFLDKFLKHTYVCHMGYYIILCKRTNRVAIGYADYVQDCKI